MRPIVDHKSQKKWSVKFFKFMKNQQDKLIQEYSNKHITATLLKQNTSKKMEEVRSCGATSECMGCHQAD